MSSTLDDEGELISAHEDGPSAWYLSWADMTTLLLTFFIVLFTFSTISPKKFDAAQESIKEAFGVPIPVGIPIRPDLANDTMAQDIQEAVENEALEGIRVQDFGDRVVLSLDTDVAFGLGRANLSEKGQQLLTVIYPVIAKSKGEVRVEGHTCDLPIGIGGTFKNNWELSTARAVTVLESLVALGYPARRIGAAGFADQRPIAPNDTEENRRKNRRVEFLIEKKMTRADE